jgi:hypothetical protein
MSSFAKVLKTLDEEGRIALSRVSKTNRKELSTLIETGIVVEKHVGAGKSLVVTNSDALENNIKAIFPHGLDAAIEGTDNRADAVAVHRNSKKAKVKNCFEFILFRVLSQNIQTLLLNDQVLPVSLWCKQAGVAAIKLSDDDTLEINGNLATVENKQVFWEFEKLSLNVDLVVYAEGRISNRFVNALLLDEDYEFYHLGDYDPVGVDEYHRIKRSFPNAKMHIPDNIDNLFKYGKESLLTKNRAIYEKLRFVDDYQVKRIVDLISRNNCGLEHEILLRDINGAKE